MCREFAGLDMGADHLLEVHHLSIQILATVNAILTARELLHDVASTSSEISPCFTFCIGLREKDCISSGLEI